MHEVGTRAWRRPAGAEDEGLLFEVFSSTWEHAVAAMPDPAIKRHFLRLQHISQESRFASRYPALQRFVVVAGNEPCGRLYLQWTDDTLHIVDIALLPPFRGRGLGTTLTTDLMEEAAARGCRVTLRVDRADPGLTRLYTRTGFRLVSADHFDALLEWDPGAAQT